MENTDQGRTVAILAYLWIPGWLIALILHGRNKTEFGSFHLRQALGIWCITLLFFFILRWMAWPVGILLLGAAIYGIVQAMNGERRVLPLVGQLFQDLFSGI